MNAHPFSLFNVPQVLYFDETSFAVSATFQQFFEEHTRVLEENQRLKEENFALKAHIQEISITGESVYTCSSNSPKEEYDSFIDDDENQDRKPPSIKRHEIKKTHFSSKATQKANQPVKSESKHLWISYGRALKTYVLKYAEDEMKTLMQKMMEKHGKLETKKDFASMFRINDDDSEEEMTFKHVFAAEVLKFLEDPTAYDAFSISRSRNSLLNQKNVVANFIKALIS